MTEEVSNSLEERIKEMKSIIGEEFYYKIIYGVFDEDESGAVRWFYTKNNGLGGRSPKELYETKAYIVFERALNKKGLEILSRNFTY
jgi:hypothetical protein